MVNVPELPSKIVAGRDRNSERCKRLSVFIRMLQDKKYSDDVIEPYVAELERRISGKSTGPAGVEIKADRV